MVKVAYLGYSERMLEYLIESNEFLLTKVVYVPHRVSDHFMELIENFDGEKKTVTSKEEIKCLDNFLMETEVVIMYKFEFIIPLNLIEKYRIINFHGGYLKSNRGAHAVVRTILNMDDSTALSMYELTGGIDVGKLIAEHIVELDYNETPQILNNKLQDGIPFLLGKLKEYLEGRISYSLIEEGRYYPKVQPIDFTIDPLIDTYDKAYAIIRSQEGYGGSLIKDLSEVKPVKKWVIEDVFSSVERNAQSENHRVVFEKGNKSLIVEF